MTDTITPTLKPDSGQLAYAWQVIKQANLSATIGEEQLQQISIAADMLQAVGFDLYSFLGAAGNNAERLDQQHTAGDLRAWQVILTLAKAQRKEAQPVLLPGEDSKEIKKVYSNKK